MLQVNFYFEEEKEVAKFVRLVVVRLQRSVNRAGVDAYYLYSKSG